MAALIANTTAITRAGETKEHPMDEVVPGDIVQLATGDMIPADAYLVATHDLFVNQSSFTGEAMPVEKKAGAANLSDEQSLFDAPNLVFMGTDVISGSGTAVILKRETRLILATWRVKLAISRRRPVLSKGCAPLAGF